MWNVTYTLISNADRSINVDFVFCFPASWKFVWPDKIWLTLAESWWLSFRITKIKNPTCTTFIKVHVVVLHLGGIPTTLPDEKFLWLRTVQLSAWSCLRYASDRFTLHHIPTPCQQCGETFPSTLTLLIFACFFLLRLQIHWRKFDLLTSTKNTPAGYCSTVEEEELWRNATRKGHEVCVTQPRTYSCTTEAHLWWKGPAAEKLQTLRDNFLESIKFWNLLESFILRLCVMSCYAIWYFHFSRKRWRLNQM